MNFKKASKTCSYVDFNFKLHLNYNNEDKTFCLDILTMDLSYNNGFSIVKKEILRPTFSGCEWGE